MTEIDLGPLNQLIGIWGGKKGTDVSPEVVGEESTDYYETLTIEYVGDVTNAENQTLLSVRYHQEVHDLANDDVIHDQVGYWYFDPETDVICQSLTIPRAVALLAGGTVETDGSRSVFSVSSKEGDKDWGIVQQPFMRDNARTTAFTHKMTVDGNGLHYEQTIMLEIYGRTFAHTDENSLTRA